MARSNKKFATRPRSTTLVRQTKITAQEGLSDEIRSLRSQIALEISQRNSGFSSGLDINLGDINEEYVPELKTLRGRSRIYERMINDPYVRSQLRGIWMTLISGVRWQARGGTPEQRELVGANILRQGPPKWWCSTSWYDRLYEIMGMMVYGFSLFGKTRSIVDGKMIFSNYKWLHPRTVDENGWILDGADNLIEVRRTFHDGTGMQFSRLPIASEDLSLYTWDRRGPNWEGNAFIRPMYKPWKLGELAEKIDILDLQNRGIAIPIAHLSGAGGPKERDTLKEILRTLRGGNKDKAFIVLEKDEKMDYLTASGEPKDAKSIIDMHHMGTAKAGGSEYSEVGGSAGGGRASASVLATGFFINVDAIRILTQEQLNYGVGPMKGWSEELQDANFDNIKEYAYVDGSKVSPTEQFDNIPLIQESIKAGLLPACFKYANETARRLGWPELTQQEYMEAMNLRPQGGMAPGGGLPPGGQTNPGPDMNPTREDKMSQLTPSTGDKGPAVPSPNPESQKRFVDSSLDFLKLSKAASATPTLEPAVTARRSLQQLPGNGVTGREPTEEEQAILALAEIDNELKSIEAQYASRLHKGQRREIEQIVAQIKRGITAKDLLREGAEEKLFKYRNQIANDLQNLMTRARNFGLGQVRDEIARSKRKK